MTTWQKVVGVVALAVVGLAAAGVVGRASVAWAQESGAAAEAVAVAVGDVAPEFTLSGTADAPVGLGDFKGKSAVVLVFYPKDFTSVCTSQLCTLRDDYGQLTEAGAVVLGINNNTVETHADFKAEHKFPFDLLVDPDMTVAASYGAAREGQPFVDRTVVVVGKNGKVLFYQKGVPPTEDILKAIEGEE